MSRLVPRPSSPGWRLSESPLVLCIGLVVVLRISLGLVAFLSVQLQPITVVGGDWLNLLIGTDRPWSELLSSWQRWDALWFQQVAEHGYSAGNGTVHFQPLFPLLSRAVSVPLFGSIVPAELLVSTAACAAALWMLYRLALLDIDDSSARLALLLIMLFPAGFFLLAPYSESLYLLLTVSAFWFARHDRPWLAGLAGMGAAWTRLLGIFMVFPLVFEYLRRRDQGGMKEQIPWSGLLASILPAVGLILLSLWDRWVVGEKQSVLQVASNWGDRVVAPWHPVPDSISHIARTGDPIEIVNLVALAVFVVLAVAALRRFPLMYAAYTVPYLAFMASRESLLSPLESVTRYLVVLFPCFLMLAVWLAKRPPLAIAWLITGGMLEVVLLQYWVHFGFVA